jgi:hypothetical protein
VDVDVELRAESVAFLEDAEEVGGFLLLPGKEGPLPRFINDEALLRPEGLHDGEGLLLNSAEDRAFADVVVGEDVGEEIGGIEGISGVGSIAEQIDVGVGIAVFDGGLVAPTVYIFFSELMPKYSHVASRRSSPW